MAGKRNAEVTRWFQQASYDLKAARWNIQGGFYDTACFLAQQAGEKALKSILYYVGARRTVLLTHSLLEMVQEAGRKVEALGRLRDEARELDLHYIRSRYPHGLPSAVPMNFASRRLSPLALPAAYTPRTPQSARGSRLVRLVPWPSTVLLS